MDIIFKGKHTGDELVDSMLSVVRLFKKQYHVPQFREVHLTVTLIDETGHDVELVDNQSETIYRTFEVYRQNSELRGVESSSQAPFVRLVVDNTKK
ncbi:MAG: hypothetical protein NTW08_05330 [Gammaproteobacteria bacterium]|nr:hypothetical protein [Gammaproteobacteria bacterium]